MITVDFPQGVPEGCTAWLEQHVGTGFTLSKKPRKDLVSFDDCAWYYERRFEPDPEFRMEGSFIPSITVKDPVKAVWFALRWSGR